jgi:hypothetical protein
MSRACRSRLRSGWRGGGGPRGAPPPDYAGAHADTPLLRVSPTPWGGGRAAYVDLVRQTLLAAERSRVLTAAGRCDAAADVLAGIGLTAPAALGALEARTLELTRAAGRRPSSYMTVCMGQWESIALALGDRTAVIRCWLAPAVALAHVDPDDDEAAQREALRTASEVALLHGYDRMFRRLHALLACVSEC